jgi:hypothetical protein
MCIVLPGCRGLRLDSNFLSGTIPDGISALTSLTCVEAMCAVQCPWLSAVAGTVLNAVVLLLSSTLGEILVSCFSSL